MVLNGTRVGRRWLTVGLVAVVAGCGGDGSAPPVEPERVTIKVAVSDSALPLLSLLASKARESDPPIDLVFLPSTHSTGAIAATHMGEADIGVLSRPMLSGERVFGLTYLHIARDGLVFATDRRSQVKDLSSDQVRRIYSGGITNWSEVGGVDADIVVLDRPEHTSPKMLLREMLFGIDMTIVEDAVVLERPGMMNVSLETLPHSIGYTSLGEILATDRDIDVVTLDGIAPTPQNVEDNVYPLCRQIGMVLHPTPSRDVMRFLGFLGGETGTKIMMSYGYSPTLLNLVITTLPERNAVRQEDRYRPLAEYLGRRLGGKVRVTLKHLPDYGSIVDEFVIGRANLAFFGSYAYALTRAVVEVVPLVRPEKEGVSTYRGVILTRSDSGIHRWQDLRGKRFAMIRDTTAGELFPKVMLKRNGVNDPGRFFGEIVLAGGHDTSVRKIMNGEVDAGAVKDLVFQQMAREDPRIAKSLRVLATSPPVPDNALVIRLDFDPSCFSCHQDEGSPAQDRAAGGLERLRLIEKLRAELLNLDRNAEGRDVLAALGADRMVETNDSDYRELYAMIEELGLELSPLGD